MTSANAASSSAVTSKNHFARLSGAPMWAIAEAPHIRPPMTTGYSTG
jgi:hypothetical protein